MNANTSSKALPEIGFTIRVHLNDGDKFLIGTVIGISEKDGLDIVDYTYEHKMPNGDVVIGMKWAWPGQLEDACEQGESCLLSAPISNAHWLRR